MGLHGDRIRWIQSMDWRSPNRTVPGAGTFHGARNRVVQGVSLYFPTNCPITIINLTKNRHAKGCSRIAPAQQDGINNRYCLIGPLTTHLRRPNHTSDGGNES